MSSERYVGIIEARMSSTRLPGKVLLPIVGRPALELQVERLRRSQTLHELVVATTTNADDDAIAELCGHLAVRCFRGSEDDVLQRVLDAARSAEADVIVEITGDCPLVDPNVLDRVVSVYQEGNADYVSNTLQLTYPIGFDVRVFSRALLAEVARLTKDPADHEHVSLYFWEHPERYRLRNVASDLPARYQGIRLTLDTRDDLELIRAIFEALYSSNSAFGLGDVVALLDRRPELMELNRHIRQKPVR